MSLKGIFIFGILLCEVAFASQSSAPLEGPYLLAVTPWTPQNRLDVSVLVKEAEYMDRAGIGGIVWPTSVEVAQLDKDGDFVLGLTALARRATKKGEEFSTRLTAVCPGATSEEAIARVRKVQAIAEKMKCHMAILARPPDDATNQVMIAEHYRALAKETTLPVIIQTFNGKSPQPDVELLIALAKEYPGVYGWVKEESPGLQVNGRMEKLVADEAIKGVFSGWGGKGWVYQGSKIGTCGVISQRAEYAPIFAKVWKRIRAGADASDPELADAYSKYLYMANLGDIFSVYGDDEMRGPHLYVLERLGIFRNRLSRTKDGVEEWKVSEKEKREIELRMKYCGLLQ